MLQKKWRLHIPLKCKRCCAIALRRPPLSQIQPEPSIPSTKSSRLTVAENKQAKTTLLSSRAAEYAYGMRIVSGEVRLAATDVSNHLACHHLTSLELSAARGERERPQWEAPDLAVIRELGLRHEARYLAFLEKNGLAMLNLSGRDEARIVDETRRAMEAGVELIAQGALRCGRWFGRPDLL